MSDPAPSRGLVISYLALRRAIGVLGVSLPVLVAVGCVVIGTCAGVQPSISDYYATEMRDVFVGVLFAIAWFLFSYRGYERKDDIAGDVACVLAMAVALFPTSSAIPAVRAVHSASAALLFSVFAYFSLALFTKSAAGVPPTPEKKKRNRVYRACGYVMIACIVLVAVYAAFLQGTAVSRLRPVFWLETFALWAFGISWVTKGEMLLKDSKPTP